MSAAAVSSLLNHAASCPGSPMSPNQPIVCETHAFGNLEDLHFHNDGLEEIPPPLLEEKCALQLDEGIEKRLRVLYKPFGGNSLFFFDENLRQIEDSYSLFHAKEVILTNQAREIGQPLRGKLLLDKIVPMHGKPSLRNSLRLEYDGGVYTFRDEYSFYDWGVQSHLLFQAKAYLN